MKLIFWGTRGSSPVIGTKVGNFNSNHSSCVEVIAGSDSLIIDAGSALGAAIRSRYTKGQREFTICMSHFHWDHILGLISLYDLFYKGISLKMYSPDENLKKYIMALFQPAYCPIDQSVIVKTFEFVQVKKEVQIQSFKLSFSEIPHTGKTFAIEVEAASKRALYMSDVNLTLLKENPFKNPPDVLICDSFHLKAHQVERQDWGHSSSEQAALFAQTIHAKKLALMHYDPSYNDNEIEQLVQEAKQAAPKLNIHATQDGDEIAL